MIRKLLFLLIAFSVFGGASLWASGARDTSGNRVEYSEGFESDLGGFEPRGPNEQLSLKGIPAHSGKHALTVSHRTSTWNGPMKDVTRYFHKGRTYHIEVWARFDQGPDYQGINVSFQKSVDGAGDVFETVGSAQMIKGVWTKVDVEMTVPKDVNVSMWKLYFETPYKADASVKPDDLITFAIDDLTITRIPTVPKVARADIPSFQGFFPSDMHIGTAIDTDELLPDNIHNPLLRHFNTFVLGNEMKQDATEPAEGVFRFTPADKFVQWAATQHVSLRGHTLLWHNQVPGWFFKDPNDPSKPASKEVLLARIEKHIKTLVGRYKGKFYAWDVVNEALGEDGNLRDSPYLKIVGSDEFIEKAFRWAHEADPNAKLVLNDFNIEYVGPKQEGFYREVKSLLDRGVPISAVGLQSHISIGQTTVNDLRATIERFAALGLDVQVTELDISIYATGQEPHKNPTRDILTDQALKYAALFKMFKEEHALGHLSTVLIWGMSDDESWLNDFPTPGRGDAPLLFDGNLQPKPAYWAVVDPSKMPVVIQKADVYLASSTASSPTDSLWDWATLRPIKDAQGQQQGWYRGLWTPKALQVLVHVNQATVADTDSVTLYLDPSNAKSATLPSDAVKLVIPRSQAISSDSTGYTIMASVPFPSPAKTMSKVGFDVKLTGGSQPYAWNDGKFDQDTSSENWGTVTLKPLPIHSLVTKGTPKFEGSVDPIWDNVMALPINIPSLGDAEDGSTVKLLWDEGHLYALYEIHDKVLNDKASDPWEQDSVELFLDQNNAKTSNYEADDGQYRVSFRNKQSFNGGQTNGFKSISRLIPGGFRVLMAVPFYAVPGAEGNLIGFDAQVNNADNSASRVGIRNWADGSNMGYQDTSGWGVLRLVP